MKAKVKNASEWSALVDLPEVTTIEVGIFDENADAPKESRDGKTRGKTLGEIATIHEFGATWTDEAGNQREIPARSFLRGWFDENEARLKEMLVKRLQANGPARWQNAFAQLALWIQADIQRRIRRRIPPPLAPATIKRKKSSVPLIDTGQLLAAITARVAGKKL